MSPFSRHYSNPLLPIHLVTLVGVDGDLFFPVAFAVSSRLFASPVFGVGLLLSVRTCRRHSTFQPGARTPRSFFPSRQTGPAALLAPPALHFTSLSLSTRRTAKGFRNLFLSFGHLPVCDWAFQPFVLHRSATLLEHHKRLDAAIFSGRITLPHEPNAEAADPPTIQSFFPHFEAPPTARKSQSFSAGLLCPPKAMVVVVS